MKPALFIDTRNGARHVVNLDSEAGRAHAARLRKEQTQERAPAFEEHDSKAVRADERENLPADDKAAK